MTSKERAKLRGEASLIEPIVYVGKDGLSEGVVSMTEEAFESHSLVKVRFVSEKENIREISNKLSEITNSEIISITGFTAVLYKENPER